MNELRDILQYLHHHPLFSRDGISTGTAFEGSDTTSKRMITAGTKTGDIAAEGKARAIYYRLSPQAQLLMPLNLDTYFTLEVDKQQIQRSYSFESINGLLTETRLFSDKGQAYLDVLQDELRQHVSELTDNEYRKEMERLGIDLSRKSSQIEGNTYTSPETEHLLRKSKTAEGKSKEEAVMLLNHRDALSFVLDSPDYLQELAVSRIESIHQLLTKDLSIDEGLRCHRVDITGTNYHLLGNEFQIREVIREACELVNSKSSIFEKALLVLVLLSYIQPFSDGNKRTARITSSAIPVANDYCPLSFRSIDSIDYRKATLIFYEQNSLYASKQVFMEQFEFTVEEYL